MKLKLRAILAIGFLGVIDSSMASMNDTRIAAIDHWSITPEISVYDSLKIQVKKAAVPVNPQALKDYINALQFKELLKSSDSPLPAFPTSAGIFNGSLSKDSLSADDQLLMLYRNLGDRKAEAGILSSLGTNAAVDGNMNKALMFFHDALKINSEIYNKQAVVKNYFSLARIYKYKKDFNEAVKYNELIVAESLASRNNRDLGEAYLNLASIWTAQRKYKDAEAIIMNKALPLFAYKLHDKIGSMRSYDQLAEIFQLQKRFSEAKWFYIQSNMVARKMNNSSGIVNSLVSLGHVKMSIGDHKLALSDFREAEALSISNKYRFKLVEIKNDLSKVYAALGNKTAASSALSEFTVLKNAILNGAALK
ncbi:tetratricopeptide repeat protein [Daejeonella sp.]|uniref:tetratricopeptide repeat protein n=1 Tax=Daejeonella sp. TaxID=2805397 RepID=UPI0030BB5A84